MVARTAGRAGWDHSPGALGHLGFDFGDPFGGRELASAAGGSREPAG